MDAATASDSVTYKPEVGEVAGSSPTSRSVLFFLFILSSLFFYLRLSLGQAAFVNFIMSLYETSILKSLAIVYQGQLVAS